MSHFWANSTIFYTQRVLKIWNDTVFNPIIHQGLFCLNKTDSAL